MCLRECACECRAGVQKWVVVKGGHVGQSALCAPIGKLPIGDFWKLVALSKLRKSDEPNKATESGFARVVFSHPPRGTLRLASARLGGSFAMAKKAKKEKKSKKSKKCVPPPAPGRPPRRPRRSRRASSLSRSFAPNRRP